MKIIIIISITPNILCSPVFSQNFLTNFTLTGKSNILLNSNSLKNFNSQKPGINVNNIKSYGIEAINPNILKGFSINSFFDGV